ncbi:single-stranded DNA-binding protein [Weissella cibaria]|uniref:single-stranded DNA-binding protein n=1 Tax=Weissella cibaria TaxID=137591 RepID=UPI00137046F5|nr:single-stranded DNA-binding protein [Weissella cibaria]MDY2519631.1 single-stranded DNA-binding protein [Weissella cibaria]MYV35340.1 single-stranded DNA-binding protein [Weissella cibaria]
MNHVSLIGRLTKEPELRYTTSGAAVASGTIAVNRDFTNANGERESDFINFVIWRKAAENFVNMTAKGSQVGLEGSWQTRSYENQQGQRVYVSELVVSNFTLVETKEQTEQRKGQSAQQGNDGFKSTPSQNNFNGQQAPQQGSFSPNDMYGKDLPPLNDDDLPF